MKILTIQRSRLNLGLLSLRTVLGIFFGVLAVVSSLVLAIIAVDLLLYFQNRYASLDVNVWGTYAAWAGAILPTIGLSTTATIWLAGRHAETLQDAEEAALSVIFERRDGAVTSLQNQSAWPLIVTATDPPLKEHANKVLRPRDPLLLFAENTTGVTFRIRGCTFSLRLSGDE